MENKNEKLAKVDEQLRHKKLSKVRTTFGLNTWRDFVSKLFWFIVFILLGFFFLRTYLWEKQYYESKEGSERAVAATAEDEEIIEIKPTEPEIKSYTVPAINPRYLTIKKLGIANARILSVGLKSNGAINTPNNIFDVAWYSGSSTPGSGGTLVINGHNGGPNVHGVFKDLDKLAIGDLIEIERGDGKMFTYSIVENNQIAVDDADSYMAKAIISPLPGQESLTLITCSGDWSNKRRTYLSRQFIRAVLVE